jgi:hypothetical protein
MNPNEKRIFDSVPIRRRLATSNEVAASINQTVIFAGDTICAG